MSIWAHVFRRDAVYHNGAVLAAGLGGGWSCWTGMLAFSLLPPGTQHKEWSDPNLLCPFSATSFNFLFILVAFQVTLPPMPKSPPSALSQNNQISDISPRWTLWPYSPLLGLRTEPTHPLLQDTPVSTFFHSIGIRHSCF